MHGAMKMLMLGALSIILIGCEAKRIEVRILNDSAETLMVSLSQCGVLEFSGAKMRPKMLMAKSLLNRDCEGKFALALQQQDSKEIVKLNDCLFNGASPYLNVRIKSLDDRLRIECRSED